MIKNFIIVFSISFIISCSTSPTVLDKVLNKNIDELQKVLKNKEKHELQILLTHIKRDRICTELLKLNISIAVGSADVKEIDSLNILNASFLAMERAC